MEAMVHSWRDEVLQERVGWVVPAPLGAGCGKPAIRKSIRPYHLQHFLKGPKDAWIQAQLLGSLGVVQQNHEYATPAACWWGQPDP